MKIIFFFMLLPALFNLRDSEIKIQNESKVIIVVAGSLMCHKCFIGINDCINSLDNRNFKYYVLLDSEKGIINKRIGINALKEYSKPDEFVFCKNSQIYNQFIEQYEISKFPEFLLVNNGNITHIKYDFMFNRKNVKQTLDSIILRFNKEIIGF
jgi:hypothetical protein